MRTKRELAKNIVDHDGGCPSDPFIECEDCPIYKVCIDCPPNLTTAAWHKHRKKLAAEIVNQAVVDNLRPRTRRKPAFKRLSSRKTYQPEESAWDRSVKEADDFWDLHGSDGQL